MSAAAAEAWPLARWLTHIQAQHWRSIDLTLDRIGEVWARLCESSANDCCVITIVGTNGKGSCAAMLEVALREAGVRVGCYTSPHLVRYNERIRVGGRMANDAELCAAFAEIERARGKIPLTYFEFGTLCALRVFARRGVDAMILEAGMGGRLDAVNLIDNDIALITSIGIDHAQWLGDSREAIAAEKAAVCKPGALAVCADADPPRSIARIADERGCALVQSGRDYRCDANGDGDCINWRSNHPAIPAAWRRLDATAPPMVRDGGARQRSNLGGVIATLALLSARLNLAPRAALRGIAATALTARCQVLAPSDEGAPEIVLDVAHNRDAADALAAFLSRRRRTRTVAVFAALADKPVGALVAALDGVVAHWHLAPINDERGQSADELRTKLPLRDGDATAHPSPRAAYRAATAAVAAAGAGGRVVVFGSFHLVGAILADLERVEASSTQ